MSKNSNNEQTQEHAAYFGLAQYINYQDPSYLLADMHRLIITYLEALEKGDITKLLINAPPCHSKSSLVGTYFPVWYLGRNSTQNILYSTYNQNRGDDVGRQVVNQIKTKEFKHVFPNFGVTKKQTTVNYFQTTHNGEYFNSAVKTPIGEREINLFIIDDPIKNDSEATSKKVQSSLISWFEATIDKRLVHDPKIIVINTRWSELDLAQYILTQRKNENWSVLNLRAIAEKNDVLRREVGEALWPEFRNKEQLQDIKKSIGQKQWDIQFQQKVVSNPKV